MTCVMIGNRPVVAAIYPSPSVTKAMAAANGKRRPRNPSATIRNEGMRWIKSGMISAHESGRASKRSAAKIERNPANSSARARGRFSDRFISRSPNNQIPERLGFGKSAQGYQSEVSILNVSCQIDPVWWVDIRIRCKFQCRVRLFRPEADRCCQFQENVPRPCRRQRPRN